MTMTYPREVDFLAIALTRPTLFMGVPLRLFFANLMLSALICIDFHTWYGLLLFVFLHGGMAPLCIKDPCFFSVWVKSLSQTPPVFNRGFWGKVNSYAPG